MKRADRGDLACYRLLNRVLREGAFGSLSLDDELTSLPQENRAFVTCAFYGVLEKSVQFDYVIEKLASKRPQSAVVIAVKMGLYYLKYMDLPPYAAVDRIVELTKEIGKRQAAGFVNALLKNADKVNLPRRGEVSDADYLSVAYSYPRWLVEKLIVQYGFCEAEAFLSYEPDTRIHIRRNGRDTTKEAFERGLGDVTPSKLGYYVTHTTAETLLPATFAVQSLASMIAVHCYLGEDNPKNALDLCAAPGGKAVYLKELRPDCAITACDLHPHRVDLIKSYAARMGTDLTAIQNDATVFRADWKGAFDTVICDAPCSGLGVLGKPDIFLRRKPEDILSLAGLQKKILGVAARYVKPGGTLLYSTCTILKEENEEVARAFLQEHPAFAPDAISCAFASAGGDGFVRLLPHRDGCDGFFIARFKRKS